MSKFSILEKLENTFLVERLGMKQQLISELFLPVVIVKTKTKQTKKNKSKHRKKRCRGKEFFSFFATKERPRTFHPSMHKCLSYINSFMTSSHFHCKLWVVSNLLFAILRSNTKKGKHRTI